MCGLPVLVLNAGSSSLKFQVVDPTTGYTNVRGLLEQVDQTGYVPALEKMTTEVRDVGVREGDLLAVGHRVVHGGSHHCSPTRLNDAVMAELEGLSRLAPLHNPPALAGIKVARAAYPAVPHFAVFDTAFFADLPVAAHTYAIDADLAEREGIRRYGMHGTSHQYVAAEAARFLGRAPGTLDLIVLHLGSGASASAIKGGRPVETSMGFTPLEGLVMATRAGDIDAGLVLHLLRAGHALHDIEDLLHHRSGVRGLAGVHDFRELDAAIESGDPRARTAYEVYCHRVRKYVGAYFAVLGGCDAVVFTAGVGENAPHVREDCLSGLERLGIEVDAELNRAPSKAARTISTAQSRVSVLVIPTNEELAIARQIAALL